MSLSDEEDKSIREMGRENLDAFLCLLLRDGGPHREEELRRATDLLRHVYLDYPCTLPGALRKPEGRKAEFAKARGRLLKAGAVDVQGARSERVVRAQNIPPPIREKQQALDAAAAAARARLRELLAAEGELDVGQVLTRLQNPRPEGITKLEQCAVVIAAFLQGLAEGWVVLRTTGTEEDFDLWEEVHLAEAAGPPPVDRRGGAAGADVAGPLPDAGPPSAAVSTTVALAGPEAAIPPGASRPPDDAEFPDQPALVAPVVSADGPTAAAPPEAPDAVSSSATAVAPPSAPTADPSPATGAEDGPGTGALNVRMIAADRIRPNAYNPNELTDAEQADLQREVARLGRVPKPVVVRPEGDGFVTIDGEHALAAAKALGHPLIPCEVIQADDYEARLQTFKRNLHGRPNPVKTGRMFREMRQLRDMTFRQFAEAISYRSDKGASEGTVRNLEKYAAAADVRNRYATEDGDAQIAGLTVHQVRAYLDLPKGKRDRWLDRGADLKEARALLAKRRAADGSPGPGTPAPATTPPAEEGAAESGAVGGTAPGADAAAEVGARGPVDAPQGLPAALAPPGARQVPLPAAPPTAPAPPADAFAPAPCDPGELAGLQAAWGRARPQAREKFLAGLLAEPAVRDFLRKGLRE